jgi:hypothetical protein
MSARIGQGILVGRRQMLSVIDAIVVIYRRMKDIIYLTAELLLAH